MTDDSPAPEIDPRSTPQYKAFEAMRQSVYDGVNFSIRGSMEAALKVPDDQKLGSLRVWNMASLSALTSMISVLLRQLQANASDEAYLEIRQTTIDDILKTTPPPVPSVLDTPGAAFAVNLADGGSIIGPKPTLN